MNNNQIKLDSGHRGFMEAYTKIQEIPLEIKKELEKELGWSQGTFYNKVRGDVKIWKYEAEVITKIFNRFGYDAWTGQPLFFK